MKTIITILMAAAITVSAEVITRTCIVDANAYSVEFTFDPSGPSSVPLTLPAGQPHYAAKIKVYKAGANGFVQVGSQLKGTVTRNGCFEDNPTTLVNNLLCAIGNDPKKEWFLEGENLVWRMYKENAK